MSAAQIAVILHLDVDPVNRWNDDGNLGEAAIANHIGDLVVQLLRGSGVVLADVEWVGEGTFDLEIGRKKTTGG